MAIIGGILGYAFGECGTVPRIPGYRLGLAIAVGAAVVYAIVMWLEKFSGGSFLSNPDKRDMLGWLILLGLPFFYLLCFVGIAEESEAEIAGLCTMLGFSIYLLAPTSVPAAALLLPAAIFFVYTVYVLPSLKVFKYTLRGYIYSECGKLRPALLSFRRRHDNRSGQSTRFGRHGLRCTRISKSKRSMPPRSDCSTRIAV